MIFWPKITNTNTNTNPNTITNINTKITKTNFRSMIFPFIITNQTQISNLWFMIYDFPYQNHKHKHNHKLTWLRRTKPKKKKKKKRKRKKMENKVEWGREAMRPWARKMRCVEGCATVRDRRRQWWNRVETVESCACAWLLVGLWLCEWES